MKFDFPRKIRSGYLIAFLLLLFSYFLSISALVQLREQHQWVDHSRQVINKLDVLASLIKDAEIGWSHYALTGEKATLKAYVSSRQRIDSACSDLSFFVRENPPEAGQVDSLKHLIGRKYRVDDAQINAAGNRPLLMDEPFRVRMNRNAMLTDSIGLVIRSIGFHETELLNLRIQKAGFSQQIVFWIIVAAGTVSVLLVLYSLITFNIESRAKRKATLEAESYHDQLEKRIRELDSANRELIELRSLERFTSTGRIARVIAHEVRNPLTNIELAAANLGNASILEADKKTFLDIITRSSKRINQLISELLSATRFSELEYERVGVQELLEEALSEAGDRLQLNHVRIEKQYGADGILLNVDHKRMKIALLNIIVNAIEAMPPEKGLLLLKTTVTDGKCCIRIRDNGKGMDAETLSRVFDPYFTSKPKGNGLGLTNTQNIVLNHQGKIEVRSEPGVGTEFTIILDAGSGR
jgi:signal transduction histidine kinase